MSKKQWMISISSIVLYLFASIIFYYGIVHLIGTISDEFASILDVFPIILFSILTLSYTLLFYRHYYIKPINKKNMFILVIATSILLIGCFVLFIIKRDYYLGNSTNMHKVIVFLIVTISLCVINFVIYYLLYKDKTFIEHKTMIFSSNYEGKAKVFIFWPTIYSLFASFFIGDFFLAIYNYKNFSINFLAYMAIALLLLVPLFNLFCMSHKINKSGLILRMVGVGLNIISCIIITVFLLSQYQLVVELAQPLYLLDFAMSFPAGMLIQLLLSVIPTIFYIITIIKNNGKLFKSLQA